MLRIVSSALSRGPNGKFSDAAVLALVEVLSADYAFLGEVVEPDRDRVELHAFAGKDGLEEAPTYELEHTPCRVAIEEKRRVFTADAMHDFPDDQMLVELDVRSYCAVPLLDDDGECIGILGVLVREARELESMIPPMLDLMAARASGEIQRRRSERQQERTRRVLRALMEASSRFVWGVDADGEPTLGAAGAWRDATGHDSGRDNWIDQVVTEDRDRVWREWRSAFETRRELELAYRVDAADGIRHLEVRGLPIHGDHGEFEGYVGVIDDATDLHRAERDLRRRNDVLRMLRAVPEAAHQGAGFLESIKVALEEICRTAGFDHGRLWMPESEDGPFRYTGLECANPQGDGPASTFPSSASPLGTGSELSDRVAASSSPVWIEGAHPLDDRDDEAVDQGDGPLTAA